jgi:uncharacterized membrane protein
MAAYYDVGLMPTICVSPVQRLLSEKEFQMNRLIVLAAATLFALTVAPAAMAGAQQDKMKTCNAEAKTKELKGAERKAFMKECLSAKKAEEKSAKTAQQDKKKTCNAEAKTQALKGKERKQFMSSCLKG